MCLVLAASTTSSSIPTAHDVSARRSPGSADAPPEYPASRLFLLQPPPASPHRSQIFDASGAKDFGAVVELARGYVGYLRRKTEAGCDPLLLAHDQGRRLRSWSGAAINSRCAGGLARALQQPWRSRLVLDRSSRILRRHARGSGARSRSLRSTSRTLLQSPARRRNAEQAGAGSWPLQTFTVAGCPRQVRGTARRAHHHPLLRRRSGRRIPSPSINCVRGGPALRRPHKLGDVHVTCVSWSQGADRGHAPRGSLR